MSSKIATALLAATLSATSAAAARPDVPITAEQVTPVATAIAAAMPEPAAMEPLWPQLVRYGISIAGAALAARGIGEAADWQALSGVLIAAGPPIWRIATTLLARRAA